MKLRTLRDLLINWMRSVAPGEPPPAHGERTTRRAACCLLTLAALMCGASCASIMPATPDAGASAPEEAPPAPTPTADSRPPAPLPSPSPEDEAAPVIPFSERQPALTETLQRTLDMLTEARAENSRLKEKVVELNKELQEKEHQIADLTVRVEGGQSKVAELEQALDKWKKDVLGFRDEMRKAEEAELEVLQEILTLLKGFKKEQQQGPEQGTEP